MASGGFSDRIRARPRRGARLEPPRGWSLGVKTSRAPDGSGAEDPAETPDERVRRLDADAKRSRRLSDSLDRKDRADLSIGADDQVPGMPLVRRRRGGMEPRTAHHGDPVEDRRSSHSPSTSVWAQDPRAEHLREEARETEWDRRLGFEGDAAVGALRTAVVAGTQALVELRWGPLTDASLPSAAEIEYQSSKPRLDDDGARPHILNTPQLRDGHYEVVPPLLPALRAVGCDPALVKLASGEYNGARYEPPVVNPVGERERGDLSELEAAAAGVTLPTDPHSVYVQSGALSTLERAFRDLDVEHVDLCLRDPLASLEVERTWAQDRAVLIGEVRESALRPEEGRMLVGEMEEYHTVAGADRDQARFVCRVHLAVGRDPVDSPLSGSDATRVYGAAPSLLGAIEEIDPDSPLLVVPAGVDRHLEYEPLLARAIDHARSDALVSGVGSGVPSPADLAVSVASQCASRHEEGVRSPFAGGSRPSVAALDPEEGAADRLAALANACSHLSRSFAADDLRLPTGVDLEARWAAGHRVYDATISDDCSADIVADAAYVVARSAAPALMVTDDVDLPRELVSRDAVTEVFALRMAARVSGLPLDDEYLAARGQQSPEHSVAVDLGSHVVAAESDSRRELADAADRYQQANERLGAVVSALEADGVVVRRDPDAEYDPSFEPVVSRQPDGTAVVDLGSAVPLEKPDSLPQPVLMAFHAEAYVVLGRATAVSSRGSDERKEAFAELHADRDSTAGLHAYGPDGSVDPVALREQLVADLFATDQMSKAWAGEGSPLRTVQRGPDGGVKLKVPDSERIRWPDQLDRLIVDQGADIRPDGNRLRSWVDRAVDPASVPSAPPPAAAPAVSSRAATAPDPDRRSVRD